MHDMHVRDTCQGGVKTGLETSYWGLLISCIWNFQVGFRRLSQKWNLQFWRRDFAENEKAPIQKIETLVLVLW